jgi:hypothetical protein
VTDLKTGSNIQAVIRIRPRKKTEAAYIDAKDRVGHEFVASNLGDARLLHSTLLSTMPHHAAPCRTMPHHVAPCRTMLCAVPLPPSGDAF